MATDGPNPPPCDQEIFRKGQAVAAINGSSNAVERWVKAVAKKARARVDWHYSGGIAQVLHLGDRESRARVYAAMRELEPKLKGTLLQVYLPSEKGLHRADVTQTPPDAIASFMDPETGQAAYVKR